MEYQAVQIMVNAGVVHHCEFPLVPVTAACQRIEKLFVVDVGDAAHGPQQRFAQTVYYISQYGARGYPRRHGLDDDQARHAG